ncbi:MAG: WD40/YVTN/BNR-like repeat-containing protein, partial [Candidatus Kapaibacterium sp.]
MGWNSRKSLWGASATMRALLLLFVAAEVVWPMRARGQWKIVAPNLVSIDPTAAWGGVVYYKQGILWVGGTNLFYSTDSGSNWNQVKLPAFTGNISDISFFDSDTGIIVSTGGAMLQTYDRGKSWNKILSFSDGWVRICYSHSPKIIHAQTDADNGGGGFMTSFDGGSNWQQQLHLQKSDGFTLSRSDRIYLTESGILKTSTDQGRNWKTLGQLGTLSADHRDCFSIDVDSCDLHRLFVVNENYAEAGDGFSHIFTSSDGGLNWSSVFSHPFPYLSGSLAVAPQTEFAATLQDGILRSNDLGTTWAHISPAQVTNFGDSRSLCALNDNQIFVMDTFGNIWATRNSGGDSIRTSISSPSLMTSTLMLFAKDTISCDSITYPVFFNRTGCPAIVVTSFSIIGSDSLNYIAGPLSDDSITITLLDILHGPHNARLILNLDNALHDTVSLVGFVANESSALRTFPSILFASDTLECDSI